MMKQRGLRLAGGSAGCAEGFLLRWGFPRAGDWGAMVSIQSLLLAGSTFGGKGGVGVHVVVLGKALEGEREKCHFSMSLYYQKNNKTH